MRATAFDADAKISLLERAEIDNARPGPEWRNW